MDSANKAYVARNGQNSEKKTKIKLTHKRKEKDEIKKEG